jgi:hypothetical protein
MFAIFIGLPVGSVLGLVLRSQRPPQGRRPASWPGPSRHGASSGPISHDRRGDSGLKGGERRDHCKSRRGQEGGPMSSMYPSPTVPVISSSCHQPETGRRRRPTSRAGSSWCPSGPCSPRWRPWATFSCRISRPARDRRRRPTSRCRAPWCPSGSCSPRWRPWGRSTCRVVWPLELLFRTANVKGNLKCPDLPYLGEEYWSRHFNAPVYLPGRGRPYSHWRSPRVRDGGHEGLAYGRWAGSASGRPFSPPWSSWRRAWPSRRG